METTSHSTLEGEVSLNIDARPLIKLSTDPAIAVCIPVGTKDTAQIGIDPKGCKWAGPGVRIPALVPIQWALTLLRMVPPLNVSLTYFSQWGLLSGEARQIMTAAALKRIRPDGYLLYWDDDVLPPRDGIYKLFAYMEQHPKVGVVGGVYTTRSDPPVPLVFREHGSGPCWDFEAGQNATPEKVWAVASGFMLARASAVKKIMADKPDVPVWADSSAVEVTSGHDNEEVLSRIAWGHDIRFCKLMWESGFEVHVHGQVICEHFDLHTQKSHRLEDACEPMRRGENINKQVYWDQLYSKEGADSWRKYPEMFEKIAAEVGQNQAVSEIGCGVGILGSKLTAAGHAAVYRGFDVSKVAVEMAKARFLDVAQKAVKDIASIDLDNVTIASELIEHLEPEDVAHLLKTVTDGQVNKFIFTVPNACMPPDQVPEHRAVYDEESTKKLVEPYGWLVRIEKADEQHLICVMEKPDGDVLDEQRSG